MRLEGLSTTTEQVSAQPVTGLTSTIRSRGAKYFGSRTKSSPCSFSGAGLHGVVVTQQTPLAQETEHTALRFDEAAHGAHVTQCTDFTQAFFTSRTSHGFTVHA